MDNNKNREIVLSFAIKEGFDSVSFVKNNIYSLFNKVEYKEPYMPTGYPVLVKVEDGNITYLSLEETQIIIAL